MSPSKFVFASLCTVLLSIRGLSACGSGNSGDSAAV